MDKKSFGKIFNLSPRQQGFTLVELLVVIAIFALIANLTMVSLNKAKRESRDAKRINNINQLRSALHLYSTENLSYPAGSGLALGTAGNLILDVTGWTASSPISPIFMYVVPRDPKMVADTSPLGVPCTAASTDVCDYGYTLGINDYEIYFYLEGGTGSLSAGLHIATKDTIL